MEVDADVQPHRLASTDASPGAGTRRRIGAMLACYWLVLFVGTHVKLSDSLPEFRLQDKVMHFAAYAGLAFLAILYQRLRKGRAGRRDLWAVWAVAAAYGMFDEVTQIVVGRTCDPLDWLADIAGAATGLGAFLVLRHTRWGRKKRL